MQTCVLIRWWFLFKFGRFFAVQEDTGCHIEVYTIIAMNVCPYTFAYHLWILWLFFFQGLLLQENGENKQLFIIILQETANVRVHEVSKLFFFLLNLGNIFPLRRL